MKNKNRVRDEFDLLPVNPTFVTAETSEYQHISAACIKPSPFNEGMPMDESTVQSYVASMSENGLIQPITVYDLGDGTFEIISGHQRFEAWCNRLHHDSIPAIVREYEPDPIKRFSAHTEANTKTRKLDGRFWYSRIQAAEKLIAESEPDLPKGKVVSTVCEMLGFNTTEYYRYIQFGSLTDSIKSLEADGIINARKAILVYKLDADQQNAVAELARNLIAEKKAREPDEDKLGLTTDEFEKIISKVLGGKERKTPERVPHKVKIERSWNACAAMLSKVKTKDEAADALSVIGDMRLQLDEAEKKIKALIDKS